MMVCNMHSLHNIYLPTCDGRIYRVGAAAAACTVTGGRWYHLFVNSLYTRQHGRRVRLFQVVINSIFNLFDSHSPVSPWHSPSNY